MERTAQFLFKNKPKNESDLPAIPVDTEPVPTKNSDESDKNLPLVWQQLFICHLSRRVRLLVVTTCKVLVFVVFIDAIKIHVSKINSRVVR